MGRLANGFIARQQNGAWHTTTANLWGGLALDKFSAKFEAHAGGRRDPRHAGHGARGQRGLGQGRPREGHRRGRRAQPDHLLRRTRLALGNLHNNTACSCPGARRRQGQVDRDAAGRRASPGSRCSRSRPSQLKAPFSAGYQIKKTITPVEQAVKGIVHARRRGPHHAGSQRQRRHDLGGDQRPGARRRDDFGRRPGAATRRSRPAARRRPAPAGPRLKSVASRPSAAITSTCPRAWSRWSTRCA